MGAPFFVLFIFFPFLGLFIGALGGVLGLYGYGATHFKKIQILGIIICFIGIIVALYFASTGGWWFHLNIL